MIYTLILICLTLLLAPLVIWAFTAFCFHASFGSNGAKAMKKYQDALSGGLSDKEFKENLERAKEEWERELNRS